MVFHINILYAVLFIYGKCRAKEEGHKVLCVVVVQTCGVCHTCKSRDNHLSVLHIRTYECFLIHIFIQIFPVVIFKGILKKKTFSRKKLQFLRIETAWEKEIGGTKDSDYELLMRSAPQLCNTHTW